MVFNIKLVLVVATVLIAHFNLRLSCVELDLINCGIDYDLEVTQGDVEVTQYPWVGALYYIYYGGSSETRAVTTVILIQKEFVIGNAADIGPIPKHNFRKRSRVLLGEQWEAVGRRVRNYVLHPEYGHTHNTLALVQLRDPVRSEKLAPVCPAPEILRNPVFYVIKFVDDDYVPFKKQVIPVIHVPSGLCKEFYVHANLYSAKMRPPHVVCAAALEAAPCVWGAGAALAARDTWGRWQLLGVGARGAGCGAPARFLDMASYAPWVQHSLQRFQRITISKISKQKYVLRSDGGGQAYSYQRFGACDAEEKINCIFREHIKLSTDNVQFQFLTYNMTIQESVEYTCLTLELRNATGLAEMRVTHYCPRVNHGAPCFFYKGSIFAISIFIMFSESCSFEMYAWGHRKALKLLDIQEWKWEEGSYYEDFSTARHEYRGQQYMTSYGFEPLDQKVWVPEYDLWTTTLFDESIWSSTTPVPTLESMMELGNVTHIPPYIPSTTSTTTSETPPTTTTVTKRTKRTFKTKTTTTTTPTPTTTPTTTTTEPV